MEDDPRDIWLPGSFVPIEQREDTKPAEALGILLRPDGKMHDEVHHLRNKVTKWAENLRLGKIPKEAAWYCLNSTIMKTIKYPLLATTLSRHEVHKVMSPLLCVSLNSFGIQKRLPHALVCGTLCSQGLGICDPFWSQLIQHLWVILQQSHQQTPT